MAPRYSFPNIRFDHGCVHKAHQPKWEAREAGEIATRETVVRGFAGYNIRARAMRQVSYYSLLCSPWRICAIPRCVRSHEAGEWE